MIPLCVAEIKGNEWKYIEECLNNNAVGGIGSFVDRFEKDFKKFVGANRGVVTPNGTSALHLALRVLGIKEGDEVIVPSLTYIATVNPIKYVGAEPVFVDVCRDTFSMDVKKVEELITPRTKAIMPVHLYGHPVDMDSLMELASKYNLYVIEDATEGLGSLYKGNSIGSIGHMGCFSFNANKLMTTGGGGMLVTNDVELGKKAKFLSTQARVFHENNGFSYTDIGYNFRLPNINASMGCAQLENLDEFILKKREHRKYYDEFLKDVNGITLPVEKEWAKNVFWLYSIVVEDDFRMSRDELIKAFSENDIETRPFFEPVHEMIPYKNCRHGDLTVTEELGKRGINLPSSVGLKKEEIEKVCEIIIG
ncbi:aminotransferase class I/II-fold pyridoxal phosphate-dependent enzyme [Sporanaerobacter acetigenes]|uniref:Perosamine synthetase n=1 Tax=Sporanaerobacter acetigenes DSM 13106 TaxID=1123281 RepID=A0A1M5SI16_9FIRM|nr:aminotransferase class I/II-fold pyridoxal phosphate-dependent enzyme [Sporanaerobacter acetigenes]SHH38194.1 perosamine synthetase [Sporanaerobacter acetigenes DSM 13106]